MILSFFESTHIANLYPLALTRPAANLRCGILTVAEKWAMDLHADGVGYELADGSNGEESRSYLNEKFPKAEGQTTLYIHGQVLPTPDLVQAILGLSPQQALCQEENIIAAGNAAWQTSDYERVEWEGTLNIIDRPYHIFGWNGQEIIADFQRLTANRISQPLSDSNRTFGSHPIFIEEGAKINCATLNTNEGPIYIGKNAEIMEGSLVRGPFAMAEGAVLKMGTKAYSNTTLGPYSVAGGEISNVVFWGYSNKGHDGFLGNAVLGEWCNLGADTNASNLKNTYDDVKVWNYRTQRFDKSGMQFCGLIMGDHSKCGINTMFNTGTVVGVACNIYGAGFPRNFVADFSWGGPQGIVPHQLNAVDKTAALVMPRRKKSYSETEKNIIHHLFQRWAVKE